MLYKIIRYFPDYNENYLKAMAATASWELDVSNITDGWNLLNGRYQKYCYYDDALDIII